MKKNVNSTIENWRKSLLKGVPLVISGTQPVAGGDSVSIAVPGLLSKRLATVRNVVPIELTEGFKTYMADISLASGQRYDYSQRDWVQNGIKNKIDFPDLFKCFGFTEYYIGHYDSNAVRNGPKGTERYTAEYLWKVDCTDLKWRVSEVPEYIEIPRKSVIFARDGGSYCAATKKDLFPNDEGGGVITMGGLYNEYRDVVFGKGNPTTDQTTRVMIRAMAWKLNKQVPFPDIGSVEEKLLQVDKKQIMAKVVNVKSNYLWDYSDQIKTSQEEIKMAIIDASWDDLLSASCMHWRHQTIMMYISNAMLKKMIELKISPKFYLNFGEEIQLIENSMTKSVKQQHLLNMLLMMESMRDQFFALTDWTSYVAFTSWIESSGISFCHLRLMIYNTNAASM